MPLDTDRPEYEFTYLLSADVPTLLVELADTHTRLANLHEEVAYNRSAEARGDKTFIHVRIRDEGILRAYEEKKWLILRLIELRSGSDGR